MQSQAVGPDKNKKPPNFGGKIAKKSTPKLNLKVQNIYIKITFETSKCLKCFEAGYLGKNV
jgi:hypothetical protein